MSLGCDLGARGRERKDGRGAVRRGLLRNSRHDMETGPQSLALGKHGAIVNGGRDSCCVVLGIFGGGCVAGPPTEKCAITYSYFGREYGCNIKHLPKSLGEMAFLHQKQRFLATCSS